MGSLKGLISGVCVLGFVSCREVALGVFVTVFRGLGIESGQDPKTLDPKTLNPNLKPPS